MKFNDLSIQEKAAVIKLGVGSGLRSLLLIEDLYNSIQSGGNRPMAVRTMDKSNADFAKRMRDPKRMTIRDWVNSADRATHKMAWAEDDVSPYIYPVVQRHGNYLKDYSDPRYSYNDAAQIALLNGDYMRTLNPQEAEWLTMNYKDYYPGFKDPLVNASIGREYNMPDYRAVAMTSSPMYGIEWNPDDDELDYRDIRNRQLYLESAGKETSRSGKGALGIFQIMPGTAKWYQDSTGDIGDIWDPIYNERVRDWTMDRNWESDVVKEGNPSNKTRMKKTLAAYNYGVGNLLKDLNKAKKAGVDIINGDAWLDYLPNETRNYVNFIMNGLDASDHKTLEKYQEWLGSGNKHIKAYGGPIKQRLDFSGNWISRNSLRLLDSFKWHGDLARYYSGQPLQDNVLFYSRYKPTRSKNPNALYIAINDDAFKDMVVEGYYDNDPLTWVDKTKNIKNGYTQLVKHKTGNAGLKISAGEAGYDLADLGKFVLTSGIDPRKGLYISYYDIWNSTPGIKDGNKEVDLTKPEARNLWGTKPFEVYDRIYLDDYYGVNSTPQENTYYGGWIAPVIVTPNEYKKGGSIHIKPENRGKFTALKKRTGHSASWFKAHGTPALRKMATFALNARKWHHKHPDGGPNDTIQTPNLVIDKYIGTKYDPTIWTNKNFLINHNIQENQNALFVGDYFRSYANSEGAQRILNNQLKWYSSYHPIRDRWYGRMIYGNPENGGKNAINQLSTLDSNGVFDLEDDVRTSKHRSDYNHVATFIGVYAPKYGEYRYEDDYEYPEGHVLPHELMHRLNDNVLHGAQSEALNLNRNTIINGHDEFNDEKYGDLQGLKFLLYDNGIYDSRGNKDATADDIEKLRLLYPYLRPLQLMDNEKAAWMINHVVDNSNFKNDYINKIAYGGPIKPFSYLPIPEVRY